MKSFLSLSFHLSLLHLLSDDFYWQMDICAMAQGDHLSGLEYLDLRLTCYGLGYV